MWLTDITEHWTDEGKLYLCAIKDACSGRIVGCSIDSRMKSRLAVTALDNAVARRETMFRVVLSIRTGALNSGRGSSFRAQPTRPGLGPWAESVPPATTQRWNRSSRSSRRNVLDRHRWSTREQLRIAIVTWIERTYHRRRRQAGLGRLTPIEYETIINTAAQRHDTETVTWSCSSPRLYVCFAGWGRWRRWVGRGRWLFGATSLRCRGVIGDGWYHDGADDEGDDEGLRR